MALLAGNNCVFDVYRGFNSAGPYAPPATPGAFCGLSGIVRQHVRNGRFGYFGGIGANALLHWTTVLLVPITDDIRDAYNTQINVDVIANGDTVMMYDYPTIGTCCAFMVVAVQRVDRGGPGDYLRVYMDRARPSYGQECPNCESSGVQCCGGILPNTLFATLATSLGPEATDCTCFPTSQTMALTNSGGVWSGTAPFGSCAWNMTVSLFCFFPNFGVTAIASDLTCGFDTGFVFVGSFTCSPLSIVAHWQGTSQECPCPNATMTITITT